jgi:hypothetical protein
VKTFDFPQKSVDWWNARRGIPTSSEFHRIITASTMKAAAAQESYLYDLIAERYAPIWPIPDDRMSKEMRYGVDTEPHARAWYEFDRNETVRQVGFCLSDCGRYGASTDGLVGEDGVLELKCPKLSTHARYLIEGVLPSEYRAQVHGELLVTGRRWCDFVSYTDGLPPFVVRVEPDEFTAALAVELDRFCNRLEAAVADIEQIKGRS